jgi:putative NADH-flavin reductase
MKLAIFGATGKTGRLVVDQALGAGHDVTAVVRDPAALRTRHARLSIARAAADQSEAIEQAVRGVDAVISAMGGGNGTLTMFGTNVVLAMSRVGVTRIVSLVGASVSLPGDVRSFSHAMLKALTRLFASSVLADGEHHAHELAASSLAYTLIRPPRLTDGPVTGHIKHGQSLKLGPWSSISRADLARFMLSVVERGEYVSAAPMVASARR